jgi:hypothetical protein
MVGSARRSLVAVLPPMPLLLRPRYSMGPEARVTGGLEASQPPLPHSWRIVKHRAELACGTTDGALTSSASFLRGRGARIDVGEVSGSGHARRPQSGR